MAFVEREITETERNINPFDREVHNFRNALHEALTEIDIPRQHPFHQESMSYMNDYSQAVVDKWEEWQYTPDSKVMIHGMSAFVHQSAGVVQEHTTEYAEKLLELCYMIMLKSEARKGVPEALLTRWEIFTKYYDQYKEQQP